MNTIVKTAALILSVTAANFGISAAHAAQAHPYIVTTGEVGLIANPAVKYNGPADRTAGLFVVGRGEQGLVANPSFANLGASKAQALFTVGVGEQGLVEIKQPAAPSSMAMKTGSK